MDGASLSSGDDALAITSALVAAGANVNLKDNKGNTALSLARKNSNLRAVDVLLKAGATESSTRTATPKATTAQATPPLAASIDGQTKLMDLVVKKPFDAVAAAALLKSGEKIDATNRFGRSALVLVASDGSTDAVKFLIANGAKVDLADSDGRTALMYGAGAASGDDALAIVSALAAAKADIDLKDKKGKNALYVARNSFNSRAADVLTKAGAKDEEPPATEKPSDDDGDEYTR